MISKDDKIKLNELIQYLEDIDEGFVSLEINFPEKQNEISNFIKTNMTQKEIIDIDMRDCKSTSYFEYIKKLSKDKEIIIIKNYALLSKSKKQDSEIIRNLNLRRDSYAELEKIFIFCFPTYFIDKIIRKAPDFWSFVYIKYNFLETFKIDKDYFSIFNNKKNVDFEKIEYLEKVLNEYNLTKKERISVLLELGDLYKNKSDFDLSLEKYNEALDLVDDYMKDEVLYRIGDLYKEFELYRLAAKYYKKALVIYKRLKNYEGIVLMYNELSFIYLLEEKYGNVERYLNKSRAVAIFNEDKFGLVHMKLVEASLYNDKKNIESTIQKFEEVLDIDKEVRINDDGNRIIPDTSIGYIHNFLGILYFLKNDLEKSKMNFLKALHISKKLKDKDKIENISLKLVKIFKLRNEYIKAVITILKSINTIKNIDNSNSTKLVEELEEIAKDIDEPTIKKSVQKYLTNFNEEEKNEYLQNIYK